MQQVVPNNCVDFAVTDVRSGAGNSIVIECPSIPDLDQAKAELTRHEEELGAAVEILPAKKPRLIVRGVSKEMSQNELLAELCAKRNPSGPIRVIKKLESYCPFVKTAAFVIEGHPNPRTVSKSRKGSRTVDPLCCCRPHSPCSMLKML